MAVQSGDTTLATKAPSTVQTFHKSGDPRRPNEVVDYKWPVVDSDKQVPDLPQVGGLIFGALGIMLKNKYFSWGSLLCSCIAYATGDKGSFNMKNGVSSASFAVVGIVTSIMRPSQAGGFGPLIAPFYAMLFQKNATSPALPVM